MVSVLSRVTRRGVYFRAAYRVSGWRGARFRFTKVVMVLTLTDSLYAM